MVKDYRRYLTIERAMSQNTVASYCSDVEKFLTSYGGKPQEAGPADITDYLSSRTQMSERSQARVISSLRSFFDWLVKEGCITDNPCDRVDSPKLGYYLPNVLSEDEIADTASSELADIRRHMRIQSGKIKDSLQKIISSPAYSKFLREPIITIRQG